MEFSQMNDRNDTPQNNNTGKIFHSSGTSENSYKFFTNISTPPSRYARIKNPFEANMIERLHLPTFSPSVFTKMSTPKSAEQFKWTIDAVSNLKPADIDEATIDQHVSEHDPKVESLVQEKIHRFFSEKVIVPSPMTQHDETRSRLLLPIPEEDKTFCNASAQTILSLPPKLPLELEEMLKPYFTYTKNQQEAGTGLNVESSLYKKLFDCEMSPLPPSPSASTDDDFSSLELSPSQAPMIRSNPDRGSPELDLIEIPELRDCSLSPIQQTPPSNSRSVCRLTFSDRMSLDNSLIAADDDQNVTQNLYSDQPSMITLHEISSTSNNWDMEYKNVSLVSPDGSSDSNKMDVSTPSTPQSRRFRSHRKRLSQSFKKDELDSQLIKSKLSKDELTDTGYNTGVTAEESSLWKESRSMIASTPTKIKH